MSVCPLAVRIGKQAARAYVRACGDDGAVTLTVDQLAALLALAAQAGIDRHVPTFKE